MDECPLEPEAIAQAEEKRIRKSNAD